MKTAKYTPVDLYQAEEACKFAYRKLGIKKGRNAATKADYKNADMASKRLEQCRAALANDK